MLLTVSVAWEFRESVVGGGQYAHLALRAGFEDAICTDLKHLHASVFDTLCKKGAARRG